MVKRLKKLFIVTTLLAALGFGVVVFISYSVVKRFIFRRIHKHEWLLQTTKFNERLRNQHGGIPVSFTSVGNMRLQGLIFIRPQAQRNFLMCHGYSRSKERLYNLIKLFPDDNILIFDYRAHGESQGDYTTIGFYEKDDVCAAFNFLQSHEQAKLLPTFGMGVSMGAVSLLGAAAHGAPFKALILDSAFKQLDEQVAKMFPEKTGLPLRPFISFCHTIFEYLCQCSMCDVNVIEWVQKVKVPIFIIHSNHDTMADVSTAHELHAAIPGQKKLWIVDYAHHAGIYKKYPDEYLKQVTSFLESVE
jgi:uncharacterized protein